jgi:hypothetical protein
MASKILWLAGSAIFVLLGTIHLVYTFFTTRLEPRNKAVIDEMKGTSPRLTGETTVWKAWIGFNASHSSGAIFFGLMNGILAAQDFSVIEDSFPVSFLTIVTSVFYLWLARSYWFRIPFVSILVAVACFIISPVLSFLL